MKSSIVPTLLSQPKEILNKIYNDPALVIYSSEPSKYFKHLFFEQHQAALEDLRALLNHAALGEWEAAKKKWEASPNLLTCAGTVYHPNRTYVEGKPPSEISVYQNPGRYQYVDRTAFQIAIMNEEYAVVKEMAKYLSENEQQKQVKEIFPDGKIQYRLDSEKITILLENLLKAVINDAEINKNNFDQMNDVTRRALYDLYDYITPQPEHKTGFVFNANDYLKAMYLYENNFSQFKKWCQRRFWAIRIEEYAASLLGTGYLRDHANGLLNKNATECVLADNTSYFAFRRDNLEIPGYNCFINILGQTSTVLGNGLLAFEKLVKVKEKERKEFMEKYSLQNNTMNVFKL